MRKAKRPKRTPARSEDHFARAFNLIRTRADAVLECIDDGCIDRTTAGNASRHGLYILGELVLALRQATKDAPANVAEAMLDAAKDCPDPARKRVLEAEAHTIAQIEA